LRSIEPARATLRRDAKSDGIEAVEAETPQKRRQGRSGTG